MMSSSQANPKPSSSNAQTKPSSSNVQSVLCGVHASGYVCFSSNDGVNSIYQMGEPEWWTPKEVRNKTAKPEDMDLWYDRFGGSSTKSILQLAGSHACIKFKSQMLSQSKLMLQAKSNMHASLKRGRDSE